MVTTRHLAPARAGGLTLPILIVISTLAARMSVSVVSPALCAREYPGQQASQFPQGWNHTAAEPHPECHHRERDGRPHGWQVASLSASRSRHRAGASTSPVALLPGAGRQPWRISPESGGHAGAGAVIGPMGRVVGEVNEELYTTPEDALATSATSLPP
jgi:hypothetical protein